MIFELVYSDVKNESLVESINRIREVSKEAFDSVSGDILQKLESKNITFTLSNINKIQRLTLSNIKRIQMVPGPLSENTRLVDFDELTTDNLEITQGYYNAKMITVDAVNSWDDVCLSDKMYMLPMSHLCDVTLCMSVRHFLRFIQTCIKYDELSSIADCIIQSGLVDNFSYLSNIEEPYELYLRETFDKNTRLQVIEEGQLVTSDLSKLEEPATWNHMRKVLNVNTVMHNSLCAYQEFIFEGMKNNLKMENPYHILNDRSVANINVALPDSIIENHQEEALEIINMWLELIGKTVEVDKGTSKDILLMQLGCFDYLYNYNVSLSEDVEFIENICEAEEWRFEELYRTISARREYMQDTELYYLYEENANACKAEYINENLDTANSLVEELVEGAKFELQDSLNIPCPVTLGEYNKLVENRGNQFIDELKDKVCEGSDVPKDISSLYGHVLDVKGFEAVTFEELKGAMVGKVIDGEIKNVKPACCGGNCGHECGGLECKCNPNNELIPATTLKQLTLEYLEGKLSSEQLKNLKDRMIKMSFEHDSASFELFAVGVNTDACEIGIQTHNGIQMTGIVFSIEEENEDAEERYEIIDPNKLSDAFTSEEVSKFATTVMDIPDNMQFTKVGLLWEGNVEIPELIVLNETEKVKVCLGMKFDPKRLELGGIDNE